MQETTQVTYGDGTITITVSSVSGSESASPDIRFGSYNHAAQSCFTEKELMQISDGENASVNFDFFMTDELSDREEQEQFDKCLLKEAKKQPGVHEGTYFEIDASKAVGDYEPVPLDSFYDEVELQFDVPMFLASENRDYYLMANVKGTCELLDDVDEEADTISVGVRNLGTLSLLYRDIDVDPESVKEGMRLQTKYLLIAGIVVLLFIWFVMDRKHKKEKN